MTHKDRKRAAARGAMTRTRGTGHPAAAVDSLQRRVTADVAEIKESGAVGKDAARIVAALVELGAFDIESAVPAETVAERSGVPLPVLRDAWLLIRSREFCVLPGGALDRDCGQLPSLWLGTSPEAIQALGDRCLSLASVLEDWGRVFGIAAEDMGLR